jgi:hypothetical protein
MLDRLVIGALAVATLSMLGAPAQAHDDKKYPDLRAQWVRHGSAQFDPDKPAGLGQKAPLNKEYQAAFEKDAALRAGGSLETNTTASCIPGGMPRTMIVYETLETIITPETTYIRGSYMNELRRVYTDGRDWPEKIRPSFEGYSIGRWLDEDGDGRYDVLEVETRGLRGPRTYDGAGIPFHKDNRTIVKERIYLDKADRNTMHDDITVIDNALTRPWTVHRTFDRVADPFWSEYVCEEGNQQVRLGKENYMISADGFLMPIKKGQPAPDLKFFNQPPK